MRVAVAWRASEPAVPVTRSVNVPRAVVLVVRTVSVAVPGAPSVAGDTVAEAPAGRPDTVSVTAPGSPVAEVTDTVYVAVCRRVTVTDPGLTPTAKSRAVTTSVTVPLRLVAPLVPVTVSG